MQVRKFKILSFLILTLIAVHTCQADVTEEQAKIIASTEIRTTLKLAESKLLRLQRREDLEDSLFSVQRKIVGKISKAAYFFEVSDTGYFVISPETAINVTSTGLSKYLIAISTKTGYAYHLFGFKDAFIAFNRLAQDSQVHISSKEEGESYAYFFNKVVNDLSENKLVLDVMQLKHKAEDYFYAHNSELEAARLFHKWWSVFLVNKTKLSVRVSLNPGGDEYKATLFFIETKEEKILQLQEYILHFSVTGVVGQTSSRRVFPRAAK